MGRHKKSSTQRLADRALALGIDLSGIDLPSHALDTPDDVELEAEAVLLYFDLKGKGFTHQTCPVCTQEFAYKYSIPMTGMRCSNRCRRIDLEARGIKWTPGKPLEARWAKGDMSGTLPLIVPPEGLSAIRASMGDMSE